MSRVYFTAKESIDLTVSLVGFYPISEREDISVAVRYGREAFNVDTMLMEDLGTPERAVDPWDYGYRYRFSVATEAEYVQVKLAM